MRLKELAKDLEKQNAANKKGKQTKILEENKRVLSESEKLDEMYVCIPFFVIYFFAWRATFVDCFDMSWFRLAASIAAEEGGSLDNNASTSAAAAAAALEDMDSDGDEDEEMILVKKWTGKKKVLSWFCGNKCYCIGPFLHFFCFASSNPGICFDYHHGTFFFKKWRLCS